VSWWEGGNPSKAPFLYNKIGLKKGSFFYLHHEKHRQHLLKKKCCHAKQLEILWRHLVDMGIRAACLQHGSIASKKINFSGARGLHILKTASGDYSENVRPGILLKTLRNEKSRVSGPIINFYLLTIHSSSANHIHSQPLLLNLFFFLQASLNASLKTYDTLGMVIYCLILFLLWDIENSNA
jgi:hypothetical protein